MDDKQIIELFFDKNEQAIEKTKEKYSAYIHTIAHNILSSQSDCEEVENDAYLALWNAIPPLVPKSLSAFLARVVRNLSLKRVEVQAAKKRGAVKEAYDELDSELAGSENIFDAVESKELGAFIDSFLSGEKLSDKNIFILRYFYFYSYKEIAQKLGYTEGKVKMSAMRTKKKLMEALKDEYK